MTPEAQETEFPRRSECFSSPAPTTPTALLEGCPDQICNCLQCAAHRGVDALAALAHCFAEQAARQEVMEAQVSKVAGRLRFLQALNAQHEQERQQALTSLMANSQQPFAPPAAGAEGAFADDGAEEEGGEEEEGGAGKQQAQLARLWARQQRRLEAELRSAAAQVESVLWMLSLTSEGTSALSASCNAADAAALDAREAAGAAEALHTALAAFTSQHGGCAHGAEFAEHFGPTAEEGGSCVMTPTKQQRGDRGGLELPPLPPGTKGSHGLRARHGLPLLAPSEGSGSPLQSHLSESGASVASWGSDAPTVAYGDDCGGGSSSLLLSGANPFASPGAGGYPRQRTYKKSSLGGAAPGGGGACSSGSVDSASSPRCSDPGFGSESSASARSSSCGESDVLGQSTAAAAGSVALSELLAEEGAGPAEWFRSSMRTRSACTNKLPNSPRVHISGSASARNGGSDGSVGDEGCAQGPGDAVPAASNPLWGARVSIFMDDAAQKMLSLGDMNPDVALPTDQEQHQQSQEAGFDGNSKAAGEKLRYCQSERKLVAPPSLIPRLSLTPGDSPLASPSAACADSMYHAPQPLRASQSLSQASTPRKGAFTVTSHYGPGYSPSHRATAGSVSSSPRVKPFYAGSRAAAGGSSTFARTQSATTNTATGGAAQYGGSQCGSHDGQGAAGGIKAAHSQALHPVWRF